MIIEFEDHHADFWDLFSRSGYSRTGLAKRIGVQPKTVGRWMSGKNKTPVAVCSYLHLHNRLNWWLEQPPGRGRDEMVARYRFLRDQVAKAIQTYKGEQPHIRRLHVNSERS